MGNRLIRYVLAWIAMLVVAVANGAFRQAIHIGLAWLALASWLFFRLRRPA